MKEKKEIIFKTDLVALLGPRPFDKLDAYDEYMSEKENERVEDAQVVETKSESVDKTNDEPN